MPPVTDRTGHWIQMKISENRMTRSAVQSKDARRWRRWALPLVLLIVMVSGHWVSLSSDASASSAVTSLFEPEGTEDGLSHAVDCVIGGALLATDRSRFSLEVIVPADAGEVQLAPTHAGALGLPIAAPALSLVARRAFLQVFLI